MSKQKQTNKPLLLLLFDIVITIVICYLLLQLLCILFNAVKYNIKMQILQF